MRRRSHIRQTCEKKMRRRLFELVGLGVGLKVGVVVEGSDENEIKEQISGREI